MSKTYNPKDAALQNIPLPSPQREVLLGEPLVSLCQRWGISEFAVFGSILRDDFKPTSDVDVLVTFTPGARKGLLTLAQIKHELEDLLGREVDISTKLSIEQSHNTGRKRNILDSARVIYVA